MKAISLWQPWASAIALGLKRNETRGWRTDVRGDVVICSAKIKQAREILLGVKEIPPDFSIANLPYGFALCVVEIFQCSPSEVFIHNPFSDLEMALGDYSAGRYVWMTRNLRKLREPVPVIGHQGFFNLKPEEEQAVIAALP